MTPRSPAVVVICNQWKRCCALPLQSCFARNQHAGCAITHLRTHGRPLRPSVSSRAGEAGRPSIQWVNSGRWLSHKGLAVAGSGLRELAGVVVMACVLIALPPVTIRWRAVGGPLAGGVRPTFGFGGGWRIASHFA